MEWLVANWVWILIGLGAVWFFLRRGGMGCGMGGHGSHDARGSRPSERVSLPPDGHAGDERSEEDKMATGARRRHRGC